MAPRTAKRKSAIEYGTSGEANLVKLDDKRARIDFAEGKKVELQVVQGNVFEDETTTLPEYVPFKAMAVNKSIPVRLSMEEGDKRVLFINPLAGEFKVKFVRFQAPEGSEPVWVEKQGKGKRPYREANPFVEVTEGRWKGLTIRGRLFDNFGEWKEDGLTTIYGEGTGSENLRDFCSCVGFNYWEVPFSENHLPEIQKIALEKENEFSIILVKGYVANWVAGLDEEDVYGDTPEEKDAPSAAENMLGE